MARPLRIEYPGAYYHVTARGVARQDIFFGDADRQGLLGLLSDAHRRWGIICHGYCLMGNHYHLELESPDGHLSRPMQWINHKHASRMNWRQSRVGHLFQGRFSSALVEAPSHLHELTRYIHLNPVRAGLVAHPADYPWSSYRAYLGLAPSPIWLQVDPTLARFGTTVEQQRRRYREFVERPEVVVQSPLRDLAFGAVLGTAPFIDWVRQKFVGLTPEPEVAHQIRIRPDVPLTRIDSAVAQASGVAAETLHAKGRHGNEARDLALYLACRHSHRGLAEVGEHYGGIRPSAVSLACRRAESRLSEGGELQARAEEALRLLSGDR